MYFENTNLTALHTKMPQGFGYGSKSAKELLMGLGLAPKKDSSHGRLLTLSLFAKVKFRFISILWIRRNQLFDKHLISC